VNEILPVILLKKLILLPNQEVKLELTNDLTREVILVANEIYNQEVIIVCPKNELEEIPDVDDLPLIGVVGKIQSKIDLPNGHLRIKILGLRRIKIAKYFSEPTEEFLKCHFKEIVLPKISEAENLAYRRKLINNVKKYIKAVPNISNSILNALNEVHSLSILTDMISSFLPLTLEKKISYMEEISPIKRAEQLMKDFELELQSIKIDKMIDQTLREELEKNQREYLLREKIKEIEHELGEEDLKKKEVEGYLAKLDSFIISEKTKEKIAHEIKKYDLTPEMSPDSSIIRNYLDWILSLPWNNLRKENEDLDKIQTELNQSHYGLNELKERIMEYAAIRKRNPKLRSPILCLVGPPGVGKTSIAFSIAKSLEKDFYKISVGGLNDSTELNGHRRTYIGASPGKIIQGLKKCGSKNPIFLIDEIDKMVNDYKGDPASVLLEILDPEQNKLFTDNYIEEPFDLSEVFFILTANNKYNIPLELRDRLEIIELSSYTLFEKLDIAKKYLIPKVLKEHVLKENEIKISDSVLENIILNYTKEAGVRDLERVLTALIRKILTESIKESKEIKKTITKKDVITYLGEKKYIEENVVKNMVPGLVYGLAYTPLGGAVLPIESCLYEGNGKVIYTGSLGKVMQESIDVAISYMKSHRDDLKLNDYYFKTKDIHIHALEGAIPKDGPSAGVTIVTSLISLIRNLKVPSHVAMTGEVSLRGDILPIGGLKEKLIGAYNEKIKTVFIPQKNHSDLKDIPEFLKENIEILEVGNYKEIYQYLFEEETKKS